MVATVSYIVYWSNLDYLDILGTIFILFMILLLVYSNYIFHRFVESKPAGRKTVLGKTKITVMNLYERIKHFSFGESCHLSYGFMLCDYPVLWIYLEDPSGSFYKGWCCGFSLWCQDYDRFPNQHAHF